MMLATAGTFLAKMGFEVLEGGADFGIKFLVLCFCVSFLFRFSCFVSVWCGAYILLVLVVYASPW